MLDGPTLMERLILDKVLMILEPCSLCFMLEKQALNIDTTSRETPPNSTTQTLQKAIPAIEHNYPYQIRKSEVPQHQP